MLFRKKPELRHPDEEGALKRSEVRPGVAFGCWTTGSGPRLFGGTFVTSPSPDNQVAYINEDGELRTAYLADLGITPYVIHGETHWNGRLCLEA